MSKSMNQGGTMTRKQITRYARGQRPVNIEAQVARTRRRYFGTRIVITK
jgi:hypothetical protein